MSAPAIATAAEGAARTIMLHGGWYWYRVATLLRAAGHRVDLAVSGIDATMPPGSATCLGRLRRRSQRKPAPAAAADPVTPRGRRSRSSTKMASAAPASRPPSPRASRAPEATRSSSPPSTPAAAGPCSGRSWPPPPPPGREVKLFDLVEAYDEGGWWPGVVSGILPKWRREARYAVSLLRFREVLKLRASLVRPRREFVCGSWVDAQDVLRGIPLYAEGSRVEVMCDEEKKGRAWMPATIIKMVGGINNVVSYGNREDSIEVLHSCFIRPQPVFDKTKFEYELVASAEVEVYQDGIWSVGVIEDTFSCEPRTYKVRVKHHGNKDEDDYFLVSSTYLRPYSKWDGQEWRLWSSKKHARKINDSVADYSEFSESGGDSDRYSSDYSPEFSTCAESSNQCSSDYSPEFFTSDQDIYQYSYVPNKRVRKENVVKGELPLAHSLNLRQHTSKSSSKDTMHMETIPGKEATGVKQLESESIGLGFRVAKGKDKKLATSVLKKLVYTQCDEKGRCFLPKAHTSKRKELHSVSPFDDIVKTGSKPNCVDVIVISDDSGYGNSVEISDTSSSNPNRKKRRINLPDKELHSNHPVHQYQASHSASNLLQAENHRHDLSLEVTRYSEEQARSCILSDSLFPQESSQDPSHKDDRQLIPLSGCLVQGLLRINETKEPELSDNLHLETAMMSIGDATSANQKTVNQSCGGAFPTGKLEPCSSVQQEVNADLLCIEAPNNNKMEIRTEQSVMPSKEVNLLCIEAPNDNKMEINNKRTGIYSKEDASLPIGVLESSLTGQQDVKADHLCIQAHKANKMEIKNERTGMSLEAADGFHLETCMNSAEMIADESHLQRNASSQNSFGQHQVLISEKSTGPSSFVHPCMMMDLSKFMLLPVPSSSNLGTVFSTSSLLLMPVHKLEIFSSLPQIPHFREVQNCPPEFREGKALGLMVSFANMAESIKNMRIQDEARLYQEKMNSLLVLEEDGFEVAPLKVRLHNLLCLRNRQINLRSRKASLEKEILEIEAVNCGLEQQVKFLDMCIMGMEEQKYQEMKASFCCHAESSKLLIHFKAPSRPAPSGGITCFC
ncbi:hypothetical protein C2845_PM07G10780 [Panicum miliaceum]|uniref:Agenet-like domain-containing protein n=1 Tax=Panicum miliaceum TaxID=4540 RepID=A0A3L6SQ66_PANMI|nr:hypothetical protein C2845_PM07G10780 [Panicum miliaceum]